MALLLAALLKPKLSLGWLKFLAGLLAAALPCKAAGTEPETGLNVSEFFCGGGGADLFGAGMSSN